MNSVVGVTRYLVIILQLFKLFHLDNIASSFGGMEEVTGRASETEFQGSLP
jgi:hypothetical protein